MFFIIDIHNGVFKIAKTSSAGFKKIDHDAKARKTIEFFQLVIKFNQ